jgi:hypothetical protein
MLTLLNPTKNNNLNYFVTSLDCPVCLDNTTIEITSDKLYLYNQNGMAQDVLFGYPAEIRERFITGYCDTCWNQIFDDE